MPLQKLKKKEGRKEKGREYSSLRIVLMKYTIYVLLLLVNFFLEMKQKTKQAK